MNNQIIPFKFESHDVRVRIIDGQEWWVGKDVCDALSLANSRDAISRLEDYEKLMSEIPTSGQSRHMWLVNEGGVYSLVLTSNKPEAKRFKRWLTTEVLPQIRKTGCYGAEADIVEGFLMCQFLDEENKRLTRQIRRYENRNFLTTGDRIDIMTLYVQKYPVSAIQRITKKGRTRIKTFLDGFFALSEEAQDAEIKAWYEAKEGKGGKA